MMHEVMLGGHLYLALLKERYKPPIATPNSTPPHTSANFQVQNRSAPPRMAIPPLLGSPKKLYLLGGCNIILYRTQIWLKTLRIELEKAIAGNEVYKETDANMVTK